MFEIKFFGYPASITYVCHMYFIIAFKILYVEYQPIYRNFLTPKYCYQHWPQKSHIGWALLNSQMSCSRDRKKVHLLVLIFVSSEVFIFTQFPPLFVLSVSVCVCDGLNVIVREKQRFAMLFQSVVLPCQYQTASTQTPVVQWWYKSYCRDRTRESFKLPESLGIQTSELGAKAHLECSDSSRTVRVVASAQGASMTLAEHYKGRDISIINSNVIIFLPLNKKFNDGGAATAALRNQS